MIIYLAHLPGHTKVSADNLHYSRSEGRLLSFLTSSPDRAAHSHTMKRRQVALLIETSNAYARGLLAARDSCLCARTPPLGDLLPEQGRGDAPPQSLPAVARPRHHCPDREPADARAPPCGPATSDGRRGAASSACCLSFPSRENRQPRHRTTGPGTPAAAAASETWPSVATTVSNGPLQRSAALAVLAAEAGHSLSMYPTAKHQFVLRAGGPQEDKATDRLVAAVAEAVLA